MLHKPTIDTVEMLRRCHYDVTGKSKGAIRKLAHDVRRRYKISAVKTCTKGYQYDPLEVDRKVPFMQLEAK